MAAVIKWVKKKEPAICGPSHLNPLKAPGFGYTFYLVYLRGFMQVSKWGNSLAIRLPAAVVKALKLKEGDEVEVHVLGDRAFDLARDHSREHALARIRAFRMKLPAGWKFDREEANRR
jgi:antitoxin MazE